MQVKKWVQAKCPKEIVLEGIDVELDWIDSSSVNAVTIRDGKGNTLRIIKGEYSGMRAMIPEPPPKIKKYRLEGTISGQPFQSQDFDDEGEADDLKRTMQSNCSHCILKVESFEIPA